MHLVFHRRANGAVDAPSSILPLYDPNGALKKEIKRQISATLLLVSLVCLSVYLSIKLVSSNLRGIPGPLFARISTFYRVWLLAGGDGPVQYHKLHKQYGEIVRTGPNHVSFSDPAMISVIYDFKNLYFKSHFYDVFKPLYQGAPMDTIFTTTNPVHKRASKHSLVANMTSCPQDYHGHISRSVSTFIRCIQDLQSPSHSPFQQPIVDFSTWSFFWGFDMTYAIMFGEPFGFMDSRSDFNGMIDAFTRIARYAALLGQVPQWCPILLGNNRFMTFMRRFQTFPDPTQLFLKVRTFRTPPLWLVQEASAENVRE
ncbi:MAG: hypothetical protein Q9195_007485 [Heterodermia aff. obscurata]